MQPQALGDIPIPDFRAAMHRVADMLADYYETLAQRPVLPPCKPGDVRRQPPAAPPMHPEPLDHMLDDYRRVIEANSTQWAHPAFMAYFASSGCLPGVIGETLAAGLCSNAMLWRTGPASTELEGVAC